MVPDANHHGRVESHTSSCYLDTTNTLRDWDQGACFSKRLDEANEPYIPD